MDSAYWMTEIFLQSAFHIEMAIWFQQGNSQNFLLFIEIQQA